MTWYSHPDISFKRVNGKIVPICRSKLPKATIVFYEIPARSNTYLTLDIIRYTMQCVYKGEMVFPCSFNTDVNEKTQENITAKVFFDNVFAENYKRTIMDPLALSLMKQCKTPYLYKALGGFPESDVCYNCQQATFINGETFLYTTSDIDESSPLTKSRGCVTVPHPRDSDDQKMEALFQVDMKDANVLSEAMGKTEDALMIRPVGEIYDIPTDIYPGLEERVNKYGSERRAGITNIREKTEHMLRGLNDEESTGDFMKRVEEKYEHLVKDMDM